jgi:hypothetical protein
MHYLCGVLAACMRRWDEAERHCEAAIAMNERLGGAPLGGAHAPRLGVDAPRPQRPRRRRAPAT